MDFSFLNIIICVNLLCILKYVHCECYRPEESTSEFLCPIDYADIGGFEMTVNNRKEVTINCAHLNSFEADQLPNVTLDVINLLQFRRCPFPENGFHSVTDKLFTDKLVILTYEYGVNIGDAGGSLSRNTFKGMQNLEYLHLGNNKFKHLEENVFVNTPKLVALDLQNNDLTNLSANLFQGLKFLKVLDLANNQIEDLPPALFQSLQKLEILELYRNKIRILNDTTFEGLHSLTSLDLSANEIEFISEYSFKNMTNLARVTLTANRLTSLPEIIFKSNTILQSVNLNNNRDFQLDDFMFANFTHLEEVDLSNCDLKRIPEHIFENSLELKALNLLENDLKEVPRSLFKGLLYLEKIDLAGNRLENIDNIFTDLHKLKVLSVEDNVIKTIDKNTFSDLISLEELNLATNKIRQIHPQAFSANDRLKIINLSRNLYSGGDGILNNLISLVDVDLSHNLITTIEDISLDNKPEVEKLDLRRNLIQDIPLSSLQTISSADIYLQFNNISIVSFKDLADLEGNHTATIYLDNNPIQCDCKNYDLFKYFNGFSSLTLMSMFNINEGLTCATPEVLHTKLLRKVALSAVSCSLEDIAEDETGCPKKCHCNWRPFDTSIVVNCSNKNLTQPPKIVESKFKWINYTEIEFNLKNNNLVSVNLTGYENITKLFLAHNKLSELSAVPKRLKVLTLDHNHLSTLSFTILQNLNTSSDLVNLTLGSNPWICSCNSAILSIFIRQNTKRIDYTNICCGNTATRLMDLNESDLCKDFTIIFVYSVISVSLILIAISIILYYKYRQEIKVWLYSKHWCLWWVSEQDLDYIRSFDAFISYSHKDEDFVYGILLEELESCPEEYELCVADRNWTVGESIATNISNSIAHSKRTVFVLSENFLQSVWAKAEFQQAHYEAIEEGAGRVIIVIYGDVDIDQIEDPALKAYLKTNTYVKWGDPYFWSKLKYALPHRHESRIVWPYLCRIFTDLFCNFC